MSQPDDQDIVAWRECFRVFSGVTSRDQFEKQIVNNPRIGQVALVYFTLQTQLKVLQSLIRNERLRLTFNTDPVVVIARIEFCLSFNIFNFFGMPTFRAIKNFPDYLFILENGGDHHLATATTKNCETLLYWLIRIEELHYGLAAFVLSVKRGLAITLETTRDAFTMASTRQMLESHLHAWRSIFDLFHNNNGDFKAFGRAGAAMFKDDIDVCLVFRSLWPDRVQMHLNLIDTRLERRKNYHLLAGFRLITKTLYSGRNADRFRAHYIKLGSVQ